MKIDNIEKVFSYINKIYKNTDDSRLIDKKVCLKIESMLEKARKITNLSFSDLLSGLDFRLNDLKIEALESFLAELRAIFWLHAFGFSKIIPLKDSKRTIQPDFKAMYKDKNSAIEVFCLTQKYGQKRNLYLDVFVNFDPEYKGSKFGRDFMTIAKKKKEQLDSLGADIKILLCVVNSGPMVNLNTKKDWNQHAESLYKKLSWEKNYYVGILTGARINGELCDTIFPEFK